MNARIDFGNGKVIELSQENTEELRRGLLEPEKERKWLVAQSGCEKDSSSRIILNLSALRRTEKTALEEALRANYTWISFWPDGKIGTYSCKIDGLTFYYNTKIIFGGE